MLKNPEIVHVLMAYQDLPFAYDLPLSKGRLTHMHVNSLPLGNYDQDLNVEVISPQRFDALMHVLKTHIYRGWLVSLSNLKEYLWRWQSR